MSVTSFGNGSLSSFIALENMGSILSTSCNLLPGSTEMTVESSFMKSFAMQQENNEKSTKVNIQSVKKVNHIDKLHITRRYCVFA